MDEWLKGYKKIHQEQKIGKSTKLGTIVLRNDLLWPNFHELSDFLNLIQDIILSIWSDDESFIQSSSNR